MVDSLKILEDRIGYCFKDKNLFKQALSHSSYVNEKNMKKTKSNERMEFLGDAVLELVTSEFLFLQYPKTQEGELTRLRASIVCEQSLANCAREIQLGEHIFLGRGELHMGGNRRDSVISDAFEALIGAIYLDGGVASAKEFVHKYVLNDIENKKLFYDSKTILQELVQGDYKHSVQYHLLKEEGPDHNKSFEVSVTLEDKMLGTGVVRSKKLPEQQAAYEAIKKLMKKVEK